MFLDMSEPSPTEIASISSQSVMRRRMWRLALMVGIVLLGVAALAVAAALMGLDAQQQQVRAETAEQGSKEQLWKSYLAQASALRLHGLQGRRYEGMSALELANNAYRELHPEDTADSPGRLQLRDEAVALLALPDIGVRKAPVALTEKQTLIALDAAQGLLATFNPTRGIVVRELEDGREIQRLQPGLNFKNPKAVTGLAWRPLGKGDQDGHGQSWLCAWFQDGAVAMWKFPGATLCYEFLPQAESKGLGGGPVPGSFSPDGRYMTFFQGDFSPLTIIDLETFQAIDHRLEPDRRALSIRPETTESASARSKVIEFIDFKTGTMLHSWPIHSPMQSLAWSHDGKWLAGMAWTGEVHIWGLETQAAWTMMGHSAPCRALVFSPDDATLMTSSVDGSTCWWNPESGAQLLSSHAGKGLSYNETGSAIIYEANEGGLGEWEVLPSSIQQIVTVPGELNVNNAYIDLSPDGNWLLASTPSGPLLWSTAPGARIMSAHLPSSNHYMFNPQGGLLSFEGGRVIRKDIVLEDGKLSLTAANVLPVSYPAEERLRKMMPSLDGRSALVEFTSRRCGLVDLLGERPFVPFQMEFDRSYVKVAASSTGGGRFSLSPDGRQAVFAYGVESEPNAAVFDARLGTQIYHTQWNTGCAQFSADSLHLICCVNGAATLLRASDGQELVRRTLPGQLATSSALALSADGLLAALAITPQTMQLCRPADLSPMLSLTSPVPGNVRCCRIAQDGSRLAVLASSNNITLWDMPGLRRSLQGLKLDWHDASAPPKIQAAAVPLRADRRGTALWLLAAAIAAAVAAFVILHRQQKLLRDFAGAEAMLLKQRQDLEQANFSLLHSQKMKALGTLAAGMAHDFNNMLSVIRMSNKLIGRQTQDNPDVTELVATVETAVLQSKQVVGSMLSYSRSEDANSHTRSVASVVRDAATLLTTEFLSGINLILSLDEQAPTVPVSSNSIEQILLNLIINASEAMQGTGRLSITVRTAVPEAAAPCVLPPHQASAYVEIAVEDTGPGIPSDIAQRIFEPFFTTKTAGNERGTGLGLSMVYNVAARDGIGIALKSVLGQGTTFALFCPVRETHSGSPEILA